jgi:hypothetical protein
LALTLPEYLLALKLLVVRKLIPAAVWSPIELPDFVWRQAVREHHAKQHRCGGRKRQFAGDISTARARIDAKEARGADLSEA